MTADSRYPDPVFEVVMEIIGKVGRSPHAPAELLSAIDDLMTDPDDDAMDKARQLAANRFVRLDRLHATVFAAAAA